MMSEIVCRWSEEKFIFSHIYCSLKASPFDIDSLTS